MAMFKSERAPAGARTATASRKLPGRPLAERIEAEIVAGRVELPVLPEISVKVRRMVAQEAQIAEIVAVIETQPAFAAAILRYANSVAFAGLREIDELRHAVARLGLAAVEQTILAISARQAFAADEAAHQELLRRLWDHSLATALAARRISDQAPAVHAETAFLAGLLHDIGKVVVLRSASKIWKREKIAAPLSEAVLFEFFDALHCRVGDLLCESWNLPAAIRRVVRRHHDEKLSGPDDVLVAIVALADRLTVPMGMSLKPDTGISPLATPAAALLGLDEPSLESLLADVREDIERAHQAI